MLEISGEGDNEIMAKDVWIKIDNNHEVQFNRSPQYWTLREWYKGRTKDGESKRAYTDTYHPNMLSVANYCVEAAIGEASTLDQVITAVKTAKVGIVNAIERVAGKR